MASVNIFANMSNVFRRERPHVTAAQRPPAATESVIFGRVFAVDGRWIEEPKKRTRQPVRRKRVASVFGNLSGIEQGAETRSLNQTKAHADALHARQSVFGLDRAMVVDHEPCVGLSPWVYASHQRLLRVDQLPKA